MNTKWGRERGNRRLVSVVSPSPLSHHLRFHSHAEFFCPATIFQTIEHRGRANSFPLRTQNFASTTRSVRRAASSASLSSKFTLMIRSPPLPSSPSFIFSLSPSESRSLRLRYLERNYRSSGTRGWARPPPQRGREGGRPEESSLSPPHVTSSVRRREGLQLIEWRKGRRIQMVACSARLSPCSPPPFPSSSCLLCWTHSQPPPPQPLAHMHRGRNSRTNGRHLGRRRRRRWQREPGALTHSLRFLRFTSSPPPPPPRFHMFESTTAASSDLCCVCSVLRRRA